MKYSILGFSQEEVLKCNTTIIENGKEKKVCIDVTDLLILQNISDIIHRAKFIKYVIDDKLYYSIQYNALLEDLPILNISKQSLKDRIDKLTMFDLIEKQVIRNEQGTFVCYRIGRRYEELIYSEGGVEKYKGGCKKIQGGGVEKYTPKNTSTINSYTIQKENNNNDNNIEEWRKDFNAYLEIVNKAKLELLSDSVFKADKEKYYPNLDYELSIEKIVKEYWGTQQGWEKRKKGKSKSLDMVRTLKKAFDYSTNRVYKRIQPQQGATTTQQRQSVPKPFNYTRAPLHPMLRFINERGVLNDGTFIEDGYRYYISPTSGQKYSIPCSASKRPSDNHEYDNLTKMWYIKEQEENNIFNDIW